MASTNKTTNYELSQFLGTDKPAWLSDYNTDMSKIDAGMKANADAVTSADGKATTNATNIGTLANLTTDVKNSLVGAINEVDSHADTAQNTATSASNTANSADIKAGNALDEVAKFDLKNSIPLTVTTNLGTILTNTLKIMKDDTNSVYKLYGQLTIGNLSGITGNLVVTVTTNSGLNPASAYEVECGSTVFVDKTSGYTSVGNRKFGVGTDGTITIPVETLDQVTTLCTWIFSPCLYFNKSFGD